LRDWFFEKVDVPFQKLEIFVNGMVDARNLYTTAIKYGMGGGANAPNPPGKVNRDPLRDSRSVKDNQFGKGKGGGKGDFRATTERLPAKGVKNISIDWANISDKDRCKYTYIYIYI
jgi:hypothetical protein